VPFFMNLSSCISSELAPQPAPPGGHAGLGHHRDFSFSIGGIVGTICGTLISHWRVPRDAREFVASLALVVLRRSSSRVPVMMTITFLLGVTVRGAGGFERPVRDVLPHRDSIDRRWLGAGSGTDWLRHRVIIGGVMLSLQWTPRQIFMASAIPLCAAIAVIASGHGAAVAARFARKRTG
jgi:hypothetical protein